MGRHTARRGGRAAQWEPRRRAPRGADRLRVRAAVGAQRAARAVGRRFGAQRRAELHHRLVEVTRAVGVHQLGREPPKQLDALRRLWVGADGAQARDDADHVAVHERHRLVVHDRRDRPRRVGADALDARPAGGALGRQAVARARDLLRALEQKGGAAVVAEARPHRAHLIDRRARQRADRREGIHPPAEVGHDPLDLRLLQHHLGHPHAVRPLRALSAAERRPFGRGRLVPPRHLAVAAVVPREPRRAQLARLVGRERVRPVQVLEVAARGHGARGEPRRGARAAQAGRADDGGELHEPRGAHGRATAGRQLWAFSRPSAWRPPLRVEIHTSDAELIGAGTCVLGNHCVSRKQRLRGSLSLRELAVMSAPKRSLVCCGSRQGARVSLARSRACSRGHRAPSSRRRAAA